MGKWFVPRSRRGDGSVEAIGIAEPPIVGGSEKRRPNGERGATILWIPLSHLVEDPSAFRMISVHVMSIRHSALLTLFLTFVLCIAVGSVQAQATRTIDRTGDLPPEGHLQLQSFTGSIEVTTWDRGRVDVEAQIEGEDREQVEAVEVRMDGGEHQRSIEVDYEALEDGWSFLELFSLGDGGDKPPVHLAIRMPRTAQLSIEDFSSSIDVHDLDGELSVEAFSSPVHLDGLNARTEIETFSGAIEVEDHRGALQIETFSGDVQARLPALTDDLQFSGFSGNVELYLPADAGFEIDVEGRTVDDLSSEFAVQTEGSRRVVGDGGPRIHMETFSGDLHLRTL